MTEDGRARRLPRGAKAFNRLALQLAGRRWFPPWAQVHHRGRRSRREYMTPVAVIATPDAFVIGLPFGSGVDWVQNTTAAGGCTIRWKGDDIKVTEPTLVDRSVALAAANRFQRAAIRRLNFPAYLQLRRVPG